MNLTSLLSYEEQLLFSVKCHRIFHSGEEVKCNCCL